MMTAVEHKPRDRRRRLGELLSQPSKSLAEFLFPPECVWCRKLVARGGGAICEECQGVLVGDYYRCRKCATPLPNVVPNDDCFRCREAKWRFDRVVTLGPYRAQLRDAVIRMKRPANELLRRVVAELMTQQLVQDLGEESLTTGKVVLLPVPNYWTHSFMGAADAAGSLATQVSKHTGLPCLTRMLRRIRKTDKQGMLSWSERAKNVRGAFEIADAEVVKGSHVIVVDDVLTSGATCAEIASRLKRAGAYQVTILVAARGTGAKESASKSEEG